MKLTQNSARWIESAEYTGSESYVVYSRSRVMVCRQSVQIRKNRGRILKLSAAATRTDHVHLLQLKKGKATTPLQKNAAPPPPAPLDYKKGTTT